MHTSLKLSTNLMLIALSATVVLIALITPAEPSRVLVLLIGGCLGALAGVFQVRAMASDAARFAAAVSALDVRTAMSASLSGRFAIYLLWFTVAVVLAVAIAQREGLLFRWAGGYASFALVRTQSD